MMKLFSKKGKKPVNFPIKNIQIDPAQGYLYLKMDERLSVDEQDRAVRILKTYQKAHLVNLIELGVIQCEPDLSYSPLYHILRNKGSLEIRVSGDMVVICSCLKHNKMCDQATLDTIINAVNPVEKRISSSTHAIPCC